MSGFAALMALSASQTKESQSAVQMALAQRQRKEVARRKQQEEEEHKQRELDLKLRLKHFEDQKKAQERHMRLEQEEQARDALLRRRAEEQRDALRYGPKKAKSVATHSGDSSPRWPASASQAATREEVRKRRLPSDDDEPSPGSSATVLTREEKRERKLQAELRRASRPTKRAKVIRGYTKAGKQLPGGAIDVMTESAQVESGSTPQSVKARIAAMPNTLTKLNVVKRDTRTIDEIMQDRAKAREAKVLDGDEAREFSDWFGKGKKEAAKRMVQHATSAETSGANTPVPQSSSPIMPSSRAPPKTPKTSQLGTMSQTYPTKTKTSSAPAKLSRSATATPALSSTKHSASSSTIKPKPSATALNDRASAKKRTRSPSLSDSSPPPAKKRGLSPPSSQNAIRNEIWKMFGKDRSTYVQRDVSSDDEDMEADVTAMEKEELRSARIARKEEEAALEAEKRHDEEKRKKRKEKELRERRG